MIEEGNFGVFTIFRDSQLVFVHLKKTIIFIFLSPELFVNLLPPIATTANLLINPGPLSCLDDLSPTMVSIISSWS